MGCRLAYLPASLPPQSHFLHASAVVMEGKLPARVLGLVMEWAELHKDELLENWDMIQNTGKWFKIEPLV